MTRDEIMRLEGRELDDELDLKLFGWDRDDLDDRNIFGARRMPQYSNTWDGMRIVVQRMRAKGWRLELLGYLRGSFAARFMGEGHGETKLGPSVDADDAPRAVALAALLALEGA